MNPSSHESLWTDPYLRATLPNLLSERIGRTIRIRSVRRRASPYASSSPIEHVLLGLEGGGRLDLVFKDTSPLTRLDAARKVRPRLVENPLREIRTYESILSQSRFGTPRFYAAVVQPGAKRYGFFMENVRSAPLWQYGEGDLWAQAAHWLARFHAAPLALPAATQRLLLHHDAEFYRTWMRRAVKYHAARGRPAGPRRQWERLVSRYERVVQRLATLPTCVIHGEFFPSNVLVRAHRKRARICPIDWEMAAVGPVVIDLASLTAGGWTVEQRRAMIHAYHAASARAGNAFCKKHELEEAVDFALLHLAVQMLGWAPRWKPPAHHAADWLGSALRLAQQAGVL